MKNIFKHRTVPVNMLYLLMPIVFFACGLWISGIVSMLLSVSWIAVMGAFKRIK